MRKFHWILLGCVAILAMEVAFVYFKPNPADPRVTAMSPELFEPYSENAGYWAVVNGENLTVSVRPYLEGCNFESIMIRKELEPWDFLPLLTVVVMLSIGGVWCATDSLGGRRRKEGATAAGNQRPDDRLQPGEVHRKGHRQRP